MFGYRILYRMDSGENNMNWDKEVADWIENPVTRAVMQEISDDMEMLVESLISTSPIIGEDGKTSRLQTAEDYMQIRGMIKALRGVLGMGVIDPIYNPNNKES